jgi:hypothetical protein
VEELAAGDVIISVGGPPPVRMARDHEVTFLRELFTHAGFEVFDDDGFTRLGPLTETVRGPDVTIGWDDIYTDDELAAGASAPIEVVVHTRAEDLTPELRRSVSVVWAESMALLIEYEMSDVDLSEYAQDWIEDESDPPPVMSVYRLRVDDPDPDAVLFGCVATSESEARAIAARAGYRQVELFDVEPIPPSQDVATVRRRIAENPLLGPQWLPIVEVIAVATERIGQRGHWQMNTYASAYGFDPYRSPFVQAMREADGGLHVEIGGLPTADLQPVRARLMEMLGWVDNASDESADEIERRQLPLPHRLFEPGVRAESIAESVLQVLVLGYEFNETDLFSFGDSSHPPYAGIEGVEVVGDGPIFGITRRDDVGGGR